MEKLENDQLYQILFSIKDQPWVFLGQKSLWALENYIMGYLNACSAFDPECFTIRWHNAFYHYACEVYQIYKEKYRVFGIIRECGYSDVDGLHIYFELLEKFAKEKCNVKKAEQHKSLQHGEVRAFRLNQRRMADFAEKYIREHSEEFFDIPNSEENGAYVFSLSDDNNLTCMVYSDCSCAKSTENLSQINHLPIFSENDSISYTALFQDDFF